MLSDKTYAAIRDKLVDILLCEGPMKAYADWIAANVPPAGEGGGYGRCKEFAETMISVFPELRLARGFYYCLVQGERQHWWCVAPDGVIVDPTAAQFPTRGGHYDELSDEDVKLRAPVGRCANCGDTLYGEVNAGKTLCSEKCEQEYVAYLMG